MKILIKKIEYEYIDLTTVSDIELNFCCNKTKIEFNILPRQRNDNIITLSLVFDGFLDFKNAEIKIKNYFKST